MQVVSEPKWWVVSNLLQHLCISGLHGAIEIFYYYHYLFVLK